MYNIVECKAWENHPLMACTQGFGGMCPALPCKLTFAAQNEIAEAAKRVGVDGGRKPPTAAAAPCLCFTCDESVRFDCPTQIGTIVTSCDMYKRS